MLVTGAATPLPGACSRQVDGAKGGEELGGRLHASVC